MTLNKEVLRTAQTVSLFRSESKKGFNESLRVQSILMQTVDEVTKGKKIMFLPEIVAYYKRSTGVIASLRRTCV